MGGWIVRLNHSILTHKFLQRRFLQPFRIDMLAQHKRGMPKGMFIFGIGLLSIVLSLGYYFYTERKINKLVSAAIQVIPRKQLMPVMDSAELTQIKGAIEQLNIPWGKLFSALEAVSSEKARIISLEPEPLKHTFTLIAESEDVKSMMEYVKALSSLPNMYNVHLILQQVVTDGKKDRIEFVVEGNWDAP